MSRGNIIIPQSHGTYFILYFVNDELSERIRNRMRLLGITQVTLADKVGVGQSQVSRLLRGERGTDLETVKSIAEVLGESPAEYVLLYANIAQSSTNRKADELKNLSDIMPPKIVDEVLKFAQYAMQGVANKGKTRDEKSRPDS